MTKRLEDAIKRLTPEQVEQLVRLAEDMVPRPGGPQPGEPPKMTWVGALKDGPYRSGLEAQEAAKHYRIFLLERGMPK